jgi:putative membrane protein (TIGR04086 family)
MKVQLLQVHWSRVIWTSILVVVLTLILNWMVVLLAFHIWGKQEQLLSQVAFWSPSILSILLTGVCAIVVARKVEREPQLHGLLVGLIGTLMFFLLSLGFQGKFDLVTLITFVLTIAAGWLGGVLGNQGPEKS